MNLKFEELIGDFVKDESGIWWLINIKGYKLYDKYPLIDIKLITCYEPGMENTNRPAKKTVNNNELTQGFIWWRL